MAATFLANYSGIGTRPVWPLFVLLGLLLVLVTVLVIAQFTDPDRQRSSEDRRALLTGTAAPDAGPPAAEPPTAGPAPVSNDSPPAAKDAV